MKYLLSISMVAVMALFSCSNSPSIAIYDQFSLIEHNDVLGFAQIDKDKKNLTKVPVGLYKIVPTSEVSDPFEKEVVLAGSANYVPISDVPRFFVNSFLIEDGVNVYELDSKDSRVVSTLKYPKMLAIKLNAFTQARGQFTEILDENGLHGFVETKSLETIPVNPSVAPGYPKVTSLQNRLELTDIMGTKLALDRDSVVVVFAKTQALAKKASYSLVGPHGIVCKLDSLDFEKTEIISPQISANSAAYEIKVPNKGSIVLSKNEAVGEKVFVCRYDTSLERLNLALFVEITDDKEASLKLLDLETGNFVDNLPCYAPSTLFTFKKNRTFGYVAMPHEPDRYTSLVILDYKDKQWKVYQKEDKRISSEFYNDMVAISVSYDDSSFVLKTEEKELSIKFKDEIISF